MLSARTDGTGRFGALALSLLLSLTAGACASSTGALPVPKPFPMPDPAGPPSAGSPESPAEPVAASPLGPDAPSAPADAYALVGTALDLRGVQYRNGGADPGGFDCSGFTQYVFAQHGLGLPREVREQFRAGQPVDPEDLSVGDLLFFRTQGRGASHVAIHIGGEEFVHAPSSTGVVRVERLGSRYWSRRFVGARRMW